MCAAERRSVTPAGGATRANALAEGFEHAVALVEDEVLQLLELEVLAAQQAEDAAGRAHDDVRRGGLERRLVRGDGHA